MTWDGYQAPVNHQNGDSYVFMPAPAAAGGRWFTIIMVILLVTGLAAPALILHEAWAFSTLTYRVDDQGVKVHHGLRRIVIPKEAITDVTVHETAPRMGRIAGTSLAGYRVGWFSGPWGRIYLVAVGRGPMVTLETTLGAGPGEEGRRYGLTPADPEAFVGRLQQMANGSGGEAVFPSAQADGTSPARPFLILGAAVILPLLGGLALVAWFGGGGPRHLRYIMGPEGITVESRWLKKHLAWDTITGIRPFEEKLQGWRMMGVAVPGYYIGSFRFRGLGNAQVYATRLAGPGVILDTLTGPWVLSPADVDGFVAAASDMMATRT